MCNEKFEKGRFFRISFNELVFFLIWKPFPKNVDYFHWRAVKTLIKPLMKLWNLKKHLINFKLNSVLHAAIFYDFLKLFDQNFIYKVLTKLQTTVQYRFCTRSFGQTVEEMHFFGLLLLQRFQGLYLDTMQHTK